MRNTARRSRPTLQPRARGISPPDLSVIEYVRQSMAYDPHAGALTWKSTGASVWKVQANRPVIYLTVNQYRPVLLPARLVCWFLLTGAWPRYTVRTVNKLAPLDLRAVNLRTCPGRGADRLAELGSAYLLNSSNVQ